MLLADGIGDLIWLLLVFGFYAVGAIIKKFGGDVKEKEGTNTSYAVELAKKRVKERQAIEQARLAQVRRQANKNYTSQSEWDRMQETKRQKLEQLRRHSLRPQTKAAPKPASPPARIPPIEHPEYRRAPQPPLQRPLNMPERSQYFQKLSIESQSPKHVRPREIYQAVPEPVKQVVKKIRKDKSEPVILQAIPTRPLNILLKQPNELRSAIILKEILDKPVALRQDWGIIF